MTVCLNTEAVVQTIMKECFHLREMSEMKLKDSLAMLYIVHKQAGFSSNNSSKFW